MAWTAKPSAPGTINTSHSLYSACVAYAPFLETSGTTITEKINTLTYTDGGLTWADAGANPPGYRIKSSGTSNQFTHTLDPLAGLSSCSGVVWLHSGTVSNLIGHTGFGRWQGGGALQIYTNIGATNWRAAIGLSGSQADSEQAHGLSDATDYTLIWVLTSSAVQLYRDMTALGTPASGSGTVNPLAETYGLHIANAQGSLGAFNPTGNGGIYGCALFNVALSEAQRQILVDQGPAFLYTEDASGQPASKRFANINFTPNKAGVWVPARY